MKIIKIDDGIELKQIEIADAIDIFNTIDSQREYLVKLSQKTKPHTIRLISGFYFNKLYTSPKSASLSRSGVSDFHTL